MKFRRHLLVVSDIKTHEIIFTKPYLFSRRAQRVAHLLEASMPDFAATIIPNVERNPAPTHIHHISREYWVASPSSVPVILGKAPSNG